MILTFPFVAHQQLQQIIIGKQHFKFLKWLHVGQL